MLALADGVIIDGSDVVRSGLRDDGAVCADVGAKEKFGNVVGVALLRPKPLPPPCAGLEPDSVGVEEAEAPGATVVVENLVRRLLTVVVVVRSDAAAALFELGDSLLAIGAAPLVGMPPRPDETVTLKVELPSTKKVVLGVA